MVVPITRASCFTLGLLGRRRVPLLWNEKQVPVQFARIHIDAYRLSRKNIQRNCVLTYSSLPWSREISTINFPGICCCVTRPVASCSKSKSFRPVTDQRRCMHTGLSKITYQKYDHKDQLTEHVAPEEGQLTVGQKVARAGKDASYLVILLIGFGVTGALVWYVFSELLFSFSPNSVYSKALEIAKENYQVKLIVGEQLKGYGEETARGRRRHVSYQEYVVDGTNFMRVKFYISGNKGKATVYADAKETSRGNFEFRYIFLETQGYPSETVILLDNR